MSDAYQLGKEAHDRGDDFSLNPYDQSDAQYDEWRHGWFDAYAESK